MRIEHARFASFLFCGPLSVIYMTAGYVFVHWRGKFLFQYPRGA